MAHINSDITYAEFRARHGVRDGRKLSRAEVAAVFSKPVPPQERPCRWAGCRRGTRSVAGYCGRHAGRIGS